MNQLNYANAAKFLYDFEEDRFEKLKNINFYGYNAWHILKFCVYYHSIYSSSTISNNTIRKKKSNTKRLIIYISEIPRFFISTFNLFFKSRRKNFTLFFPLCIDKRKHELSNTYYNILFDSFILENQIPNYAYIETAHLHPKDFKDPSLVQRDANTNLIFFIAYGLSFLIKKNKHTKVTATSIKKEWDDYCKKQSVSIDITIADFIHTLAYFRAEYISFKCLFKLTKPRLVLFTDQSATGKMAAALSSGAKVLELQHGLMDEFYPHYTHHPFFKEIKNHLIIPTKIVLFGDYYKDILLKKNYKDESDFFVIGSFPMHSQRAKSNNIITNGNQLDIFFPTQGKLIFEKTKQLLQIIKDCFNDQIHLTIKPHPNETEENKEWFRSYCDKEYLKFNDSNKSIMDFIEESTIVIGFDSTTLLEAVGLGKPAITITSPELPKGVHSLINTTILEDSIKISSPTKEAITDLLKKYQEDVVFKERWFYAIKKHSIYVYADNYVDNCKSLIKTILK